MKIERMRIQTSECLAWCYCSKIRKAS